MNILYIEDTSKQSGSLGFELKNTGYQVDVVSDSDSAIELSKNKDFDLIVLDLDLPRESSLLLLHEIREISPEIKILLLSEHDQIHDRITALIQGANDYLVKPITFSELDRRIQNLLHGRSGHNTSEDDAFRNFESSDHTNRLIAELIDQCSCNQGPIDLVISEIKAIALLQQVRQELNKIALLNNVQIELPSGSMPTLLTDARLMQHLLMKLIICAISRCPEGRQISLNLNLDDNQCAIWIDTPTNYPMYNVLKTRIFGDLKRISSGRSLVQSDTDLSLVRNYAKRLNLDIRASLPSQDLFRIELSKIKVI